MKNNLLKFEVFFISLLFGMISCSNPVVNGDISSPRTAKNSNMLTFEISAKDACGITEPSGEVSFKVGNTFDVLFTENDGFQFERWEVINKNTKKTYNDVISIEDKKNPETKITILKSVDNIMLRAVGKIRPKYISTIPEFVDEGVYADSVIVINFDKKISEDSFYYTEEDLRFITADELLQNEEERAYGYIFNNDVHFKNLSITSSSDENLLQYFNPPVLENGTVLKISPKKDNPLVSVPGSTLEIDVFVSPDIFDEDGVLLGGEGIQWRYKVNSQTDITPPEFTSFELCYNEEKLTSGNKFVPENHVKDTLIYNYSAKDEESGINYIQIETKRLTTPTGLPVEEESTVKIIKNDEAFAGEINLNCDDGLLQLTFSLFDCSGNESAVNQVYFVAKDTCVDISGLKIFNTEEYQDDDLILKSDLIDSAKTICWKNEIPDIWNDEYFTPAENLSYKLLWGNKKGDFTFNVECTKEMNFSNGVWTYTIPSVNKDSDMFIRLEVTDELGNFAFTDSVIPAAPAYYTYQRISNYDIFPAHYRIFYSSPADDLLDGECEFGGVLYYSEDKSDSLKIKNFANRLNEENSKYADIYVNDISECTFYFRLACITDNSYLLSTENEFSIVETDSISAPEIDEIVVEKGLVNSGKNIATISFSSEPPEGNVYQFFWGKEPDEINNYEQNPVFKIDSGIKTLYYKTVCIDSENNLSKTSEILSYDLSEFDFDTIPPQVTNYQCICNYQKSGEYTANDYYPVIACDICYDEYEIVNDKAEYVLYSVPVESADISFDMLSEEDIVSSPFVVNTFDPPLSPDEAVMIWNNVEGASEAESYFYVLYLEDINGNYSFFPLSYNKHLLENKPLINFVSDEDDSSLVDITFEIEKEEKCKDYQVEYFVYDAKNEPQGFTVCSTISETKNELNQVLKLKDSVYSTTVKDVKDSFYFGFAKALYQVNKKEQIKYTYPIYFYTGLDSAVECELKDIIDDMNGAQVYCDRPCIVMTYWSSENYEYSIEAWETYGAQCNPMYISAKNPNTNKYEDTFKFYKFEREAIPMGKYFVIIVHFADGTTKMSKTINTN